jgi:simple sugar transport system permease protein
MGPGRERRVIDLALVASAFRLATPLLFAALGGVVSERSGVVNIALEGKLLAGAFAAAVAAEATGNPWMGVAAAVGAGMLIGLLHAVFGVWLRGDQIVVGVALNLFVAGVTQFLMAYLYGSSANTPPFPGFGSAGTLWFPPLVWWALLLVPVVHLYLRRTRAGLRLEAVGEHPEAAETLGVNPLRVRFAGVVLAGALAGLGGAYLALETTQFVKNMSAGRGFIALAAVIFGKWRPFGAAGACLFFGLAEAVQIRLQGFGIPTQFVQMIPYLLTMVALAGFVGRSRPPAGLGKPLAREK